MIRIGDFFVTITEAYNAIGKWLDANNYLGPCREIYLRPAKNDKCWNGA